MGNILEVKNLNAGYLFKKKKIKAVRNVSFNLKNNEFLGIAGESGCGKSTLAFSITKLLEKPGMIFSGEAKFEGKDLLQLKDEEIKEMRWKEFSIVFQASMNVLNPVMKIRNQIYNVIKYHKKVTEEELKRRSIELLNLVNVSEKYLDAYPHQLSGGMKQRVVIAMAIALNPKLIIMDEPTTALDVVVQRKILQEIDRIRKQLGFSIIFITHDLSLLVEISDTIMIMYGGEIMEYAPSKTLYSNPLHPYSIGLINSFPPLVGIKEKRNGIAGSPPDLSAEIKGCPFYDRCDKRIEGTCNIIKPKLILIEENHKVACHLYRVGVVND